MSAKLSRLRYPEAPIFDDFDNTVKAWFTDGIGQRFCR